MPDHNNVLAKGIGKNYNRTILGAAPLIVFIGPPGCGKSMVLMSLLEYLRVNEEAYTIAPNLEYITNDSQYEQRCERFMAALEENVGCSNGWKVPVEGNLGEILLDIREGGGKGPKYRVLDAPGEDFFCPFNPDKDYAAYLKAIISKTRKGGYPIYYVMLLNPSMGKELDSCISFRTEYENRLIKFLEDGFDAGRGDKVILLYNKIDQVMESHEEALKSILDDYYPSLGKHLMRLFLKFFSIPVCDGILASKSGIWTQDRYDGCDQSVYATDEESEIFAKMLWEKLTNNPKNALCVL